MLIKINTVFYVDGETGFHASGVAFINPDKIIGVTPYNNEIAWKIDMDEDLGHTVLNAEWARIEPLLTGGTPAPAATLPADVVKAYHIYRMATIKRGGARDDDDFVALYQPMDNARQQLIDMLGAYIPTEETDYE